MPFEKPTPVQVLGSLERCAQRLSREPCQFLGEGWGVWTFQVGDHVLRFPKNEWEVTELELERKLLPSLASQVTVAIPVTDVYCLHGPNGVPFAGHRKVPGTSLFRADEVLPASVRTGPAALPLAPDFGRAFGRTLRELHSFPIEQALALGIPVIDGDALRSRRLREYEEAEKRVFEHLDWRTRTTVEGRFAEYLDDSANFDFEPRFIHGDLDRQNVLVDAETGELTGIIDFGGAQIGKAALDFLIPVGDFKSLGIEEQLNDLLEEYGLELDVHRSRQEVDFIQKVLWPISDVQFAQHWNNKEFHNTRLRALERLDN